MPWIMRGKPHLVEDAIPIDRTCPNCGVTSSMPLVYIRTGPGIGVPVLMFFSDRFRFSHKLYLDACMVCGNLLKRTIPKVDRLTDSLPPDYLNELAARKVALYKQISAAYPNTTVIQHASPSWLRPHHLDVYLPDHNIGVDYRGAMHQGPNTFGNPVAFRRQQGLDIRKDQACSKNGCYVVAVYGDYNPDEVLRHLKEVMNRKPE